MDGRELENGAELLSGWELERGREHERGWWTGTSRQMGTRQVERERR